MNLRETGRRWLAGGALALALPALTGCVTVAEFRKLEDQVVRMRGSDGAAGDRARVADLSAEIAELRQRIEDLQGQIEVGEHTANRALQEAESARREAAQGTAPPAGAYLAAPPKPGGAPPQGSPYSGAVPSPGASYPASTPSGPGGYPAPGAVSPPSEPVPGAGLAARQELDAYRLAYDAWRTRDSGSCVDRFRDFLQTYPSSSYADAAAYWMADCYFQQGDYQTAILRFDDVASRYPSSDKAAEALYRQGEALLQLGPSFGGAARKAFERVIEEYPDSKRARQAEQQLQLLRG
ncbi:MAG: tol-pal system protein YbgF [Deltaproteobacteria bacterium]|jgi:tol-pal system protein YbgF|nr:tol-pal system protein YbgF [Deltaproteobacteria bacterium]